MLNILFYISLFLNLAASAQHPNLREEIRKAVNKKLSFDESALYNSYIEGSMGSARYKTLDEVVSFAEMVLESYPEIAGRVDLSRFGNPTAKGRFLTALRLGDQNVPPNDQKAILLDGAHHSREPTSVQMVLYTTLRLLYEYEKEEVLSKGGGILHQLWRDHSIYVIPVVNVDGYQEISEYWKEHGRLEMVRKNFKNDATKECRGSSEDVGVDLNRNYDFAFGIDDLGSSGDPCAEDFRGRSAFSEPATKQVKTFLEETTEGQSVKIALNFHAYGNLLVHPFSYLNQSFSSEHMVKYRASLLQGMLRDTLCSKDGEMYSIKNKFGVCEYSTNQFSLKEALTFYDDIYHNAGLPSGAVEGNGYATVEYPANGEASDWMLGAHGIYAFSPELGTSNHQSDEFFIKQPAALQDVLRSNYPWIKYTILKLIPKTNLSITNLFEPRRQRWEQTTIIVSIELQKESTRFQSGRPSAVATEISCHEVWFSALHQNSQIANLEFYDGKPKSNAGTYFKTPYDSSIASKYAQLLLLDQDLSKQFESQKGTPADERKKFIENFILKTGKHTGQIIDKTNQKGVKMCFVAQKGKHDSDLIQFSVALNLTRQPDLRPDIFSVIKQNEDLLSIEYGIFDDHHIDEDVEGPSAELGMLSKEETEHLERPFFRHNVALDSSKGIYVAEQGDVQVLVNSMELAPEKMKHFEYETQGKKKKEPTYEFNEAKMKGKGAAEATEVVGSLMIVLAVQIPLFLFTFMYMFDLNLRQDIIYCGLCRRKSIDEANEVEDDEDEESQETALARIDRKKRFCFRHNHRVKMILQRKILASQMQAELEEQNQSGSSSGRRIFQINEQEGSSSSGSSSSSSSGSSSSGSDMDEDKDKEEEDPAPKQDQESGDSDSSGFEDEVVDQEVYRDITSHAEIQLATSEHQNEEVKQTVEDQSENEVIKAKRSKKKETAFQTAYKELEVEGKLRDSEMRK